MLSVPNIVASKHWPVINFLNIFLEVLPNSIIFSAVSGFKYAFNIFLAWTFNFSFPVKIYIEKTIETIKLTIDPITFPTTETDFDKKFVASVLACSCNSLLFISISFINSLISGKSPS